ncbi:MAG: ribonuclease Z [Gemmatimonadota bacterium]
MRLTFLGTASSRPTVTRNVSCIALQREGDLFLLDCGEGTQRQMMRYGVGFGVRDIFITHLHSDHYLGIIGLVRTLGLQGRQEPLGVWGPPGGRETLEEAVRLGGDRVLFPVDIRELPPGESVCYGDYRIQAFPTEHTASSVGYALLERQRLGRFDVERARALGVPEGPDFGRLHRGEPVRLADGRIVQPEEVVGPPRPGRAVVYTGDTRPAESTVEIAAGADLLVHEATFGEEERGRARETRHSTARQAAEIATRARVRSLVLTHLSARYSEQPRRLRREAAAVFPACTVAEDGDVIEVFYADASRKRDR